MSLTKSIVSLMFWILLALSTKASDYSTLIETSLLVNLDNSLENPNRRYSNSFQQFGQENSITNQLDLDSTSPNPDLLSSLETIFNTLDENSLFDAFDHTISYSIDLKNNGSYGNYKSSTQIIKNNLEIATEVCVKRALALNINPRTIAENISSRTIENFVVNQKAIANWADSTPEWLEILAEIIATSSLSASQNTEQKTILPILAEVFTDSVLDLYNLDSNNVNFSATNLYPGIEPVSNDPSVASEIMLFGGDSEGYYKFDPLKTKIFALSVAGIIKVASAESLIGSNVDRATSEKLFTDTIDSITQSYFKFTNNLDGDHSLFTYDLTKSFALGATQAALTSALENSRKSENFSTDDFIEFASSQISKAVSVNSLNSPNISILNLMEACATGNALGTQLSTILNNESNLDSAFAGVNRDKFAKFSSRGLAQGTIESISSNIDNYVAITQKAPDMFVSEVASRLSKGSVFGATTLAIYNPAPKELLSIINNAAQGSAEGSTNVLALNNVDKSQGATEDVVVQIARASAHGSALAATFGMAALDNARPDTLSYDRKTIAAVESASFGASYGAIIGAINNGVPDTVVIKQASKQGSIEGALLGAGLGTKHDEDFFNTDDRSYIDAKLNSKMNIIKVVGESTSNAALSANTSRATKTIRTNSKNMIMLMRKFNISPRTTNPSRIFQKNKSDTNIESEFPIKENFRAASPI